MRTRGLSGYNEGSRALWGTAAIPALGRREDQMEAQLAWWS